MKTYISLTIALLLAFHTYGISLVLFLVYKYFDDKFTANNILIKKIMNSYNSGEKISIPNVSNQALHMVFDSNNGRISSDLNNYIKGYIIHPMNNSTISIMLNKAKDDKIEIKATESQYDLINR